MEWIKRNLLFVIGALVALALVGVASLYLWNQYSTNSEASKVLGEKYEELDRLNTEKLHPGNERVDNVKRAQEQQARVKHFLQQTTAYFRPIPPIPDTGGKDMSDFQFASALRTTVEQLRRAADVAGVNLASNYYFTFEVQRTNLIFGKDNLRSLSAQLGEVKAICDIVFAARVNSLDGLRRERVTPEDSQGFSDYHDRSSATNSELAVLAPYDLTIQCFSAELGRLLAGFANAPYPILVQRLNVERAAPSTAAYPLGMGGDMSGGFPPGGYLQPGIPGTVTYGGRVVPLAVPRGRGGRPVPVINEQPVRVTLWLQVVKLKPPAK